MGTLCDTRGASETSPQTDKGPQTQNTKCEQGQISESASDEETKAQGKPRYPVAASWLTQGSPVAQHPSLRRKPELHQLCTKESHQDDSDG